MPASRVGAMAWHPPIFLSPDSFAPQETPSSARGGPPAAFSISLAQFLPATYALPDLPSGGILGGIPKLAAGQSAANDPWAAATNGLLGGVAQPSNLGTPPTSMFGPSSRAALGSGDPPPSLPQWSPMSGQSLFHEYASFDTPRDLIPPSPNLQPLYPTPFSVFQRAGLTSGDGDQFAPQSASKSSSATDAMLSPDTSGSATGYPTIPFDSTGWGRIQLAAGDREKIDPEEIFDPLAPFRVDLYNAARSDLRQIQPNNYALSVLSLRAPGSAPTMDEIGELKYAYRIAQSTQPLADTASQIAKLIEPFAWNFRTVSVLQTSKGIIVAPSGEVELEEDQIAAAKAAGATDIAAGGVDAEVAALEYAKSMGGAPQFIAASRPFCPSCREAIRGRGGLITSPTTAVFPRNIPSLAFPLR
jgi:hypothetical protein